jgi:putative redox protein
MATSKVIYQGELRTTATHLASGQAILTDAPVDNQGKGEAFSPTDLTATSLAACIITTMGIYAKRENMDVQLEHTELEVTKVMSKEPPRRIAEIHITITFKDKNISEHHKTVLERVVHTCPVAISLHPDLKQVINFVW